MIQRLLTFAILSLVCAASAAAQEASVIVRLRADASVRAVADRVSAAAGAGARPVFRQAVRARSSALLAASRLERYMVVSGAVPAVVAALRSDAEVELVEPNVRRRIDAGEPEGDAQFQWALERIEAAGAWRRTRGSAQVPIGFVDTGIEFTHPDLKPSLWINAPEDRNGNGRFEAWSSAEMREGLAGDLDGVDQDGNGYIDDVIGYDFVDQTVPNIGDWAGRDGVPWDDNARRHGTGVAGVMSATADNGIGIAGLAPESPLVTLRAFDATGNGEDDDIAAAIVYAADNGVRVLNMSFGDAFSSTLLRDAVRYAGSRGLVLVASAGNEGTGESHYPSSWPEVIGVAMTDSLDYRNEFSNYGSQVALTAPGVQVATTAIDSGYARLGGTSIAAPYVAAAAALVLSAHPEWTAAEVRSTLELTADDRGTAGWDPFYGAGRLNVRRAVEMDAPALVELAVPALDRPGTTTAPFSVVGTASSPFLDAWQLFIGAGEIPDEQAWQPLTEPSRAARVHDVLAQVDPRELVDTVYTLRLVLRQTDGRQTERRIGFLMDRTAPRFTSVDIRPVWRFDRRALAVVARTDDRTRLEAHLRRSGAGEYRVLALEPERTGLVHTHYLLLTSTEVEPDVPYDLYLTAANAGGDTAMLGSANAPIRVVRPGEGFPGGGFARKSYTLPFGFMDDETAQLYGGGTDAIAINRAPAGGYGKLMVYNFEGGAFVARDSIAAPWLPRGFGDIDADGRRELLVQSGRSTAVFGQADAGGSVTARLRWIDTAAVDTALLRTWGAALEDVDADGTDELIARTDARDLDVNGGRIPPHHLIAGWTGSDMRVEARLFNPTSPARSGERNEFGPPAAVVRDFDGDGRSEILVGDDDADFMLYRYIGDRWELMLTRENEGKGGSDLIAAGDFDADGRVEAVIGWRSELLVRNADGEYDPPFWNVQVVRINVDGTDSVLWHERFAYVRPADPFRSGISAGDLDGQPGDELVISTFPGIAVLRWDRSRGGFTPLWWREGSVTNDPIIFDFDRDGRAELGVGNTRDIEFWQDTTSGRAVPGALEAWALNDSSAFIRWSTVSDATRYVVYRAVVEPGSTRLRFESIIETAATSLVDSGLAVPSGRLASGVTYAYTVSAIVSEEGPVAPPVTVYTHAPLRLTGATAISARELRLELNGVATEDMLRPGAVRIRDRAGSDVSVSSVTSAGDNALAVHLLAPHPGDTLTVRPTWLFRDLWRTPADTTVSVTVVTPQDEPTGERFIATRATYVEQDGLRTIVVEFNAEVDAATAAVASNYVLSPEPIAGTGDPIVAATVDPGDRRRVRLTLAADYPIGALGRRYLVTISGVRSADGRMINNGGSSTVGFTFEAPDLAAVSVYPQPFAPARDERATFAGLPRGARVEIYTVRGALLRTLQETEHVGGVDWDGRDAEGRAVPTGVYLYRVTVAGEGGQREESDLRKIAVIGDEG